MEGKKPECCIVYFITMYDLANLVKQHGAPYFTWENIILWSSAPMSGTVLPEDDKYSQEVSVPGHLEPQI